MADETVAVINDSARILRRIVQDFMLRLYGLLKTVFLHVPGPRPVTTVQICKCLPSVSQIFKNVSLVQRADFPKKT